MTTQDQRPGFLFIGCSASPVAPNAMADTGELFGNGLRTAKSYGTGT